MAAQGYPGPALSVPPEELVPADNVVAQIPQAALDKIPIHRISFVAPEGPMYRSGGPTGSGARCRILSPVIAASDQAARRRRRSAHRRPLRTATQHLTASRGRKARFLGFALAVIHVFLGPGLAHPVQVVIGIEHGPLVTRGGTGPQQQGQEKGGEAREAREWGLNGRQRTLGKNGGASVGPPRHLDQRGRQGKRMAKE